MSTFPAPLSHVTDRSTVGELTGRPGCAGWSHLVSLKAVSATATILFYLGAYDGACLDTGVALAGFNSYSLCICRTTARGLGL